MDNYEDEVQPIGPVRYSRLRIHPEFIATLQAHAAREEDGEGRMLQHPTLEGEELWLCDVGWKGCRFCEFVWEKAS